MSGGTGRDPASLARLRELLRSRAQGIARSTLVKNHRTEYRKLYSAALVKLHREHGIAPPVTLEYTEEKD